MPTPANRNRTKRFMVCLLELAGDLLGRRHTGEPLRGGAFQVRVADDPVDGPPRNGVRADALQNEPLRSGGSVGQYAARIQDPALAVANPERLPVRPVVLKAPGADLP